jgi:hypothetical protein
MQNARLIAKAGSLWNFIQAIGRQQPRVADRDGEGQRGTFSFLFTGSTLEDFGSPQRSFVQRTNLVAIL